MAVAFSPSTSGTHVVSGSADTSVILWDIMSSINVFGPLKGHSRGVCCVVFSRDETYFASCSLDGTIRLWDALTGDVVSVLDSEGGPVYAIAFSPDGA